MFLSEIVLLNGLSLWPVNHSLCHSTACKALNERNCFVMMRGIVCAFYLVILTICLCCDTKAIVDATFAPDGLHIATASLDGFVRFYEVSREDDANPRSLNSNLTVLDIDIFLNILY